MGKEMLPSEFRAEVLEILKRQADCMEGLVKWNQKQQQLIIKVNKQLEELREQSTN